MSRYPRLRSGDPGFGPTCECGQPKAKQARHCQPCSGARRGFNTVPVYQQRQRWERARYGYTTPVPIGDPDTALIDRAARLELARAAASGEVAELVSAQAKDERSGHRIRTPWIVSLDATDRFGRPLYELVAA